MSVTSLEKKSLVFFASLDFDHTLSNVVHHHHRSTDISMMYSIYIDSRRSTHLFLFSRDVDVVVVVHVPKVETRTVFLFGITFCP